MSRGNIGGKERQIWSIFRLFSICIGLYLYRKDRLRKKKAGSIRISQKASLIVALIGI